MTIKRILNKALRLFESDCREPRLFRRGRRPQSAAPKEPGLYWLIRTDNGEPWYIGQASNLAQRLREHSNHFSDIELVAAWRAIVPCFTEDAYDLLKDMERQQIKRYQPEGNHRQGGGGKRPHLERCERWGIRRCQHPGECLRWRGR